MRHRPGFAARGGETRQVSLSGMGRVHVCFQQTRERTNKPKRRSSGRLRDARRGFYYLLNKGWKLASLVLQLCLFSPFAASSLAFPSTFRLKLSGHRLHFGDVWMRRSASQWGT